MYQSSSPETIQNIIRTGRLSSIPQPLYLSEADQRECIEIATELKINPVEQSQIIHLLLEASIIEISSSSGLVSTPAPALAAAPKEAKSSQIFSAVESNNFILFFELLGARAAVKSKDEKQKLLSLIKRNDWDSEFIDTAATLPVELDEDDDETPIPKSSGPKEKKEKNGREEKYEEKKSEEKIDSPLKELQKIIEHNRWDQLVMFTKQYPKVTSDFRDAKNNTIMHLALTIKPMIPADIIEALLKTGIDLSTCNHDNETPLIAAIKNDHAAAMEKLLHHVGRNIVAAIPKNMGNIHLFALLNTDENKACLIELIQHYIHHEIPITRISDDVIQGYLDSDILNISTLRALDMNLVPGSLFSELIHEEFKRRIKLSRTQHRTVFKPLDSQLIPSQPKSSEPSRKPAYDDKLRMTGIPKPPETPKTLAEALRLKDKKAFTALLNTATFQNEGEQQYFINEICDIGWSDLVPNIIDLPIDLSSSALPIPILSGFSFYSSNGSSSSSSAQSVAAGARASESGRSSSNASNSSSSSSSVYSGSLSSSFSRK